LQALATTASTCSSQYRYVIEFQVEGRHGLSVATGGQLLQQTLQRMAPQRFLAVEHQPRIEQRSR